MTIERINEAVRALREAIDACAAVERSSDRTPKEQFNARVAKVQRGHYLYRGLVAELDSIVADHRKVTNEASSIGAAQLDPEVIDGQRLLEFARYAEVALATAIDHLKVAHPDSDCETKPGNSANTADIEQRYLNAFPEYVVRSCLACLPYCARIGAELDETEKALVKIPATLSIKFLRLVPGLITLAVGFLTLWTLSRTESSVTTDDILAHADLATMSVRSATADVDSAKATMDSGIVRDGKRVSKNGFDVVPDALSHLLSAASSNSMAFDALDRAQALAHMSGEAFANEFSSRVGKSQALQGIRKAAIAGVKLRLDTAKLGASTPASIDYELRRIIEVLTAESKAIDRAASAADPQGLRLGTERHWATLTEFEKGFIDRSPMRFAVRLAFAVTFVVIISASIVILSQAARFLDANDRVAGLIDDAMRKAGSAASTTWVTLAPIGAVAGLIGAFQLAPKTSGAQPEVGVPGHIGSPTVSDTLASADRKVVLELKQSVDALSARIQKLDTLITKHVP